jgi:hypothetical protein
MKKEYLLIYETQETICDSIRIIHINRIVYIEIKAYQGKLNH